MKTQLPKADDVMGALVYEVPIDVAPGRLNLDPTIKFVYNNQDLTRSSLVGKGWSIDIPPGMRFFKDEDRV